ncbi:MAG: helix-turn-helix domain-containing protein [Blautia sp.]
MDSNCRKLDENPYRECRKKAAIYNDALSSMERAAEMLGVSVSTLSNYELGVTVPPVDIIIVMADLYRAPQLKTMYCKNECLIGRCMPIAVDAGRIDNIVLRIVKQFGESRIEDLKDKLIEIAEDGKVSKEEAKELNDICGELDELVKTVWELKLVQERECCCGNSRKN